MNRYEVILALEDIPGGSDAEVTITYGISKGDPQDEPEGLLRYETFGATYVVSTENNGVYNKVANPIDADSDGVTNIQDQQILCALATAFAKLNLDVPEEPIQEPEEESEEGQIKEPTDASQQPK